METDDDEDDEEMVVDGKDVEVEGDKVRFCLVEEKKTTKKNQ